MNADIKAKWVAALRSGEYVQGQHRLRTGDKFCCLGVLCDLHLKEGRGGRWVPSLAYDDSSSFQLEHGHGSGYALPHAVSVWAGLSDPVVVRVSGVERHRIGVDELNDGARDIEPHTFAQIADAIEEQL